MKSRVATLFLGLILVGCSSAPKIDSSTAEGGYALGQKYEKDERYEEAIAQYNQVKNQHPYSSFATESELRVGDIHFKREDYAEAQSSYQLFKELHPTHAKIDYVTYQLGLSIFNQLPSTIDRDLSLADKALLYFDEVLSSYPKSEYAPLADQNRKRILHMLAEKELYIADFYYKRDSFDSALVRYEGALERFAGVGLDARALLGAARCAYHLKDQTKTESYLNQLKSKFADSDEARRGGEELGRAK